MKLHLVDSSGWLEYFIDGKNASVFAKPLKNLDKVIVPTICLFEVFKKVFQKKGEDVAMQIAAVMQQGQVVDLNASIAFHSVQNSVELNLPMADSIIYTIAQVHEATLWTQDSDFYGFEDVKYFSKP